MTFLTSQFGQKDTTNSTILALAAAGSFIGTYQDVAHYNSIYVLVTLAAAQTVTLAVDYSPDNGVTVTTDQRVVSPTATMHTFPIAAQYYRVRLLANLATAATGFLETHLGGGPAVPKVLPLNATLANQTDSLVTHSVGVAQQGANYTNLQMDTTTNGLLVTGTNPVTGPGAPTIYDGFGRTRVTQATTLVSSKLTSTVANVRDFDDQQVSGAGTSSTFSANRASVTMAVSNLTAGRRVRQSFARNEYIPGTSALIYMTAVVQPSVVGITKLWGLFDANNGVFFQHKDGVFSVVQRSSVSGAPVDTVVNQASFNGTPTVIDFTKAHIYRIQYAWLGVGDVQFCLQNGAETIVLHTFFNAGLTSVWESSPTQPFRYEIQNSGAGPVASIEQICCSYQIEGTLVNVRRYPRSADRGSVVISVPNDGNEYVLLALRQSSTNTSALVSYLATSVAVLSGTAQFVVRLRYHPTFGGAALVWLTPNESVAEYARPGVGAVGLATATGGALLSTQYNISSNQTPAASLTQNFNWYLGFDLSNNGLILAITVQKIDGGVADDFVGSIDWVEFS